MKIICLGELLIRIKEIIGRNLQMMKELNENER